MAKVCLIFIKISKKDWKTDFFVERKYIGWEIQINILDLAKNEFQYLNLK
jgi:hypothetical protein